MTRYLLMGTAAALLFFSILCRFFPGMRLKRLLGETANLSVSPNTILRQCVLKYSSLCELNGGRMNTSVYVEKFLRQLKFGRFSLRFWDRLGGQLLLLSVFADGIGACMGLMGGQTLGNVIWFYLQAFLCFREKSSTLKKLGMFEVRVLLFCAFFATLIGKQQTARIRRMKKNPGGRRNEPQK